MIVAHESTVFAPAISHPDVKNARMKVLISPEQGWADYVMRVVELDPDGFSPRHAHPWPHINYVLEGNGILHINGKDHDLSAGSYAYVPAGANHQFKNTGTGTFRFICIVPKEGHS